VSQQYLQRLVAQARAAGPKFDPESESKLKSALARIGELEAKVVELRGELRGCDSALRVEQNRTLESDQTIINLTSQVQMLEAELRSRPKPKSKPLPPTMSDPSQQNTRIWTESEFGEAQQAVNRATIAFREAIPGPDKDRLGEDVKRLQHELDEACDAMGY
jgi:hypothetical protein